MTTPAQRTTRLLDRLPVERLELSRRGELLAELASTGEPRWTVLVGEHARELDPAADAELPLAARLPALRRERAARVLAWRPGRRMVVRVEDREAPGGTAIVKALRSGRLEAALARHVEGRRAAEAAGLLTAEVLAVDAEHSAFALRDLGDERVRITAERAQAFADLGAALARFQGASGASALEPHGAADELDVLRVLAEKCARLLGCLPAGWEAARTVVAEALRAAGDGPAVRTHRDLHDGQLLLVQGSAALLDFDLLCLADEALDPANLLAHLELRALQGLATEDGARACRHAFRAGYGRAHATELQHRLRAWGAAARLRLALVYHLRPRHAHLGPILVGRALAHLAEERHGNR